MEKWGFIVPVLYLSRPPYVWSPAPHRVGRRPPSHIHPLREPDSCLIELRSMYVWLSPPTYTRPARPSGWEPRTPNPSINSSSCSASQQVGPAPMMNWLDLTPHHHPLLTYTCLQGWAPWHMYMLVPRPPPPPATRRAFAAGHVGTQICDHTHDLACIHTLHIQVPAITHTHTWFTYVHRWGRCSHVGKAPKYVPVGLKYELFVKFPWFSAKSPFSGRVRIWRVTGLRPHLTRQTRLRDPPAGQI